MVIIYGSGLTAPSAVRNPVAPISERGDADTSFVTGPHVLGPPRSTVTEGYVDVEQPV